MNPPNKPVSSGVLHRVVDADSADQRIDNFLLAQLRGVPRSLVYRLIRSGQVRVNSGRVTPRYRLRAGDRVRVPPVACRPAATPPAPEGLDWLIGRIVYEDSRLLVLDKPAGLAVHGGSGVKLGAIEALRVVRPDLARAELAHRLDRATSGCLLIAKRRSVLRQLHELLRSGLIDKRYLALVQGRWPKRLTQIDAPLRVHRSAEGEARVKVDVDGKPSRTRVGQLVHYADLATLLTLSIPTGRTHQIRVHCAWSGHPVAGDDRYGDREFDRTLERFGLHRMFLHAQSIGFTWPGTTDRFSVSTALPAELDAVLRALAASAQVSRPAAAD